MEVIVNNQTPLTVKDQEGNVLFEHNPVSNVVRLTAGIGNLKFIEYKVNIDKGEKFISDKYIQQSIQGVFE